MSHSDVIDCLREAPRIPSLTHIDEGKHVGRILIQSSNHNKVRIHFRHRR